MISERRTTSLRLLIQSHGHLSAQGRLSNFKLSVETISMLSCGIPGNLGQQLILT